MFFPSTQQSGIDKSQGKNKVQLEIFDVGHGACAMVTHENGACIMIDCGQSNDPLWKPGDYLYSKGIEKIDILAITNYDEDHVNGLSNLRSRMGIYALWRNKTVTPSILKYLKSENGMGAGIDELVNMATKYTHPARVLETPGLVRTAFHLDYPDFKDENNLSMVVHLSLHGIGFLFPGDLETAGWEALLAKNEHFRYAVKNTQVLVASHHGRESGKCEDIFSKYGCAPYAVVISDKGYMHDTQQTVPWYRSKVMPKEIPFRGEMRHVLTTRHDGTIRFNCNSDSWSAG